MMPVRLARVVARGLGLSILDPPIPMDGFQVEVL